jgi:hypothetical protein
VAGQPEDVAAGAETNGAEAGTNGNGSAPPIAAKVQ